MSDGLEQISVEDDKGRILTGIGVTESSLQETVDARTPDVEPRQPTTPTPQGEPTPEQAPKLSRGQKRFSELTSERDQALHQAREAARERDELKQRLESRPPEPREPIRESVRQPTEPAKARVPETRTKPAEDEVGSTYQTYGEYVEDLADWKAEQRIAQFNIDALIRDRIEADQATRTFTASAEDTFQRGRKAYADFDAVREKGPGSLVDLASTPEQWRARQRFIIGLPNSEHVQYAIAKDADLARRLGSMSDVEFGVAVSAIAPAPAVANAPASTAAVGSVPAPPPYVPVGSGSTTTAPPLSELAQKAGFDFDKSGYRERRAKELGRGGSRRP